MAVRAAHVGIAELSSMRQLFSVGISVPEPQVPSNVAYGAAIFLLSGACDIVFGAQGVHRFLPAVILTQTCILWSS